MHFNQQHCFKNQIAYVYVAQLKFIGKAQLYTFKILSSGVQTNLLRLLITCL